MRRLIPAAAVVLLTAACSSDPSDSTAASSSKPSASASAAASTAEPAPSATTPSTRRPSGRPTAADTDSGAPTTITQSAQGRGLPPGPFAIKPVKCGPYTAAEKARLGTTARGGLIFRYTNHSQSVTDAVKLNVGFASGGTVLGDNVNGNGSPVGPRQSGEAAVDAVGPGGQDLTFTSCQMMTYSLAGAPAAGSYAP